MKSASIKNLVEEDEREVLHQMVSAKLTANWLEVAYLRRMAKIPASEQEQLSTLWLFDHVADVAVDRGMGKDEFLAAMLEAFKGAEVARDEEEEEEDEEEEEEDDGDPIGVRSAEAVLTDADATFKPGELQKILG